MNDTNDFDYVTYIQSTPRDVWAALTTPASSREYWGGNENISDWHKGSKWQHISPNDKQVWVEGEVLGSEPNKLLVLSWVNPKDLTDSSRVTINIEGVDDLVKLHVNHGQFRSGSDMPTHISGGWPRVLCSLKSWLETGKGLNVRAGTEPEPNFVQQPYDLQTTGEVPFNEHPHQRIAARSDANRRKEKSEGYLAPAPLDEPIGNGPQSAEAIPDNVGPNAVVPNLIPPKDLPSKTARITAAEKEPTDVIALPKQDSANEMAHKDSAA